MPTKVVRSLMLKLFLPVLVVALLFGCSEAPVRPEPVPTPEFHHAAEAMASGEYGRAHVLYQHLASQSRPPESWEFLFQSALALYRAELLNQATEQLEALPDAQLPPTLRMERQLLLGRIHLKRDPDLALSLLLEPVVAQEDLPERPDLYAEFHHLRAQAFGRLGNHLESVREYILRELHLSDSWDIEDNQQAIWQALAQLTPLALQQLRYQPPPDILSGWMELAEAAQNYRLGPAELERLIAQWRERYPGHPATPEFLASLLQRSIELTSRPREITLLLPLSGRLAAAGHALQDGILAAWYADPQRDQTRLHVIDVGNQPEQILDYYQQAIAHEAGFVIGPLDKSAVEILARQEDLALPTLALNLAEPPRHGNLYQFGLAPEDEARAVAEYAMQQGYQHAALLIPGNALGERMHQAFAEHWQQLGGKLLSSSRYDPSHNDFADPIKSLLNIQDSELRHRRVNRMSNLRVEFTPRRRQDIDFIFLAAQPRQARLIRPQLRFHHAGDLPVLATSHLYEGGADPSADRDMDGILFCDTPWILDAETATAELRRDSRELLSLHTGQLQRLVAMGMDAYQLVPLLAMLKSHPHEYYAGETGMLSVDRHGQISRQLQWARFHQGLPQRLQDEVNNHVGTFTP